MKNNTEKNYSMKQGRLPVFLADSLEIRDPVLAFDEIVEEIGIEQYFILLFDRKLQFFPAKIAPCCVGVLGHISPLCPADTALPDAIFPRKFIKAFYQTIV